MLTEFVYVNDMYLPLHRDKRSEAFQCLVGWLQTATGWRVESTAWLCILGSDLRQGTGSYRQLETTAQRERQRESFLAFPTATVRVVVVCICDCTDRQSHKHFLLRISAGKRCSNLGTARLLSPSPVLVDGPRRLASCRPCQCVQAVQPTLSASE